jgi:hypothetical protein
VTSEDVKAILRRHYNSDWVFVDELRNGTGYSGGANGYMDGFAINCFPSRGFERIAFEIKLSRADFTRELRKPLKRKIALLYSNRFYFVTPPGLLKPDELPPEAGLWEIQEPDPDEFREDGRKKYNRHPERWLREVAPAPHRDTPPPSWSLFCSMARRLKRLEEANGAA